MTPEQEKDALGLNIRQVIFISAVRKAPSTLGTISKVLKCSTAAMTSMRDKLVGLGMVEEVVIGTDRRSTHVSATDHGRDVLTFLYGKFLQSGSEAAVSVAA